MERIDPADFFDRPEYVREMVARWAQPLPCDMCDQPSASKCPRCGLLLCAGCRESEEHRAYCAAVLVDAGAHEGGDDAGA